MLNARSAVFKPALCGIQVHKPVSDVYALSLGVGVGFLGEEEVGVRVGEVGVRVGVGVVGIGVGVRIGTRRRSSNRIVLKFGVRQGCHSAATSPQVSGRVSLHVRTCTPLFYISGMAGPITVQSDVWLQTTPPLRS